METSITLGFISLSVCWFISTIIVWICKSGRRREYAESISHRKRMARLERLRRLREEEGLDAGRGEEFDELYAREREERRRREQSRRNRRKRKNRTESDDAERVDASSVRDVLRRRLMGKESSSSRRDETNHANDGKPSGRAEKPGVFKTKLQELSMSPRTRKKKKKEALHSEKTQETSMKDYQNLQSRRSKHSTSSRNDLSSAEESKTGSESAKERRGSWLFKSAKRRRKEQLRRELELRRKVRAQTISPKRRKPTSAHKKAAKSLLSSPVRYDGSRLSDVSTARLDDIATARNTTDSTSERLKRNQRSHQTARDLVKEDLKKRLQQMDFKLTPSKTPTASSSEEENISSSNRGNESQTMSSTASMRSTRKSSKRRPRPSSGQRGQQRSSESIRQADSPKYSNAGRRQPLGRSIKHQNQRKHQVSDDSAIPDNSDGTGNSQKEREENPSESNETSMEESETGQKVSIQNKHKDGKVKIAGKEGLLGKRIAGKEGRKSGKAIRSSERLSKVRKNERNKRHGYFERMLAHRRELEKKILSVKGSSESKEKERKEPKRRRKLKDQQRHSLEGSISNKNSRNLNESSSQESTGKSSSLKVRKSKKKETKAKKFVGSRETGETVTKTKRKRSANCQNSSKTLNTALGNKVSSCRKTSSHSSSSRNSSANSTTSDRTEASKETKTPKKPSKSTISPNESIQLDESAGKISEHCGAKSYSTLLSPRFTESESNLERPTKKSRIAVKSGRKHEISSTKKFNLNRTNKKLMNGKADSRSSPRGAKKRFRNEKMERRRRSESSEDIPEMERSLRSLRKGSKRKLSMSGKKVKSRTSVKEKFSSKHNHAKTASSELFAAAIGK